MRNALNDLLSHLPPELREAARALAEQGLSQLPQELHAAWIDGAFQLVARGSSASVLLAYLRLTPAVIRQGGAALQAHVIATALSIALRTDAGTTETFFTALAIASRRLMAAEALLGFLEVVDEVAALAPRGLNAMLERTAPLLDELSVDGLRRWALLGVQSHVTDLGAQDRWFKLESHDARAVLRAAGEGILYTEVERRLGFYLRALWARTINLRSIGSRSSQDLSAERGRRVANVGEEIHMPAALDIFPGQDGVAVYRAAAAHAAAHLTYSTARFPVAELKPVQIALVSLIEDARVERLALRTMPGLLRLWLPYHVAMPTHVKSAVSLMARLARALLDPDYVDDNAWVNKGREMFESQRGALEDATMSRGIGVLLGNDLGQMRVQFNFKTYLVEPLYRDDNTFLWEANVGQSPTEDPDAASHAVQLSPAADAQPVDLEINVDAGADGEQPRDGDSGDSADEQPGGEVDVSIAYRYDEWDYAIGLERPLWCTLLERRARIGDSRIIDEVMARNQETVSRLTNLIKAAQIQRPVRQRRQLEGDKLDLDASVAAMVDLRSGRTPDPRVHERRGRTSRDLAVLVLLDLSQSTNDYVPSAGTSVLNLAREATALVSDAMEKIGDSFAIHGFDSNGRHEIEYYRFKDFDEPYAEQARGRLAGMTGQLSTRMGTALRHAGFHLRYRRATRKLILLVTDGEPHDIDVHDRKYLVFDAKHAVEEQTRYGVATFCISLDPRADEYVRRIFGARNYLVLDHLRRLPEKLPTLYVRLTH
jgi:hypothetical protein